MNKRRKFALLCTFLGTMIALVCLYKTTPLSMMAFFNGSLALYLLGMLVYLYDVIMSIQALKGKGS
jgi:hypothetical protein